MISAVSAATDFDIILINNGFDVDASIILPISSRTNQLNGVWAG